ncbi:biotin transporter BioY [Plastorhodobacter daqingensis]|uniref:Biotin transporter n=1 Tax=Plastorhodobacter daqingensis TaxID=1387281 RepID=A0ABW2UGM9_9RHOB
MNRDTTLSAALGAQSSLLTKALLVLGGSLVVGLSAQVSVPMLPVPMTLQTLAISIIGLTYGSRLAAATMVAYLAQGAMGMPVFAGGGAGAHHLLGPTGGFLMGFIAMAWATGLMVERGFDRGLGRLFVAALLPALALFLPGMLWLWAVTPLALDAAFNAAVLPFLSGALVKAGLAALTVAGGWKALRRLRG